MLIARVAAEGRVTKFVRGEFHRAEYAAGVFILAAHAFLVGNVVFESADKVLCRACKSYYRENAEAYYENSLAVSA